MSLNRWDASMRPAPRQGDAVFDTIDGWHHAMIYSGAVTVSARGSEQINVIQMNPPLLSGAEEILAPGDKHWLGTFPDLGAGTLEAISVEAVRLIQVVAPSPNERSVYDFRMHGVVQEDPNASGSITVRASCSSLLEHCYETQEVDLVNQEAVPELASAEHLGEKVGRDGKFINRVVRAWKPEVSWPCRILFPSYQMKAFEQNLEDLPYEPQLADHPYMQPATAETPPASGTEEDADIE